MYIHVHVHVIGVASALNKAIQRLVQVRIYGWLILSLCLSCDLVPATLLYSCSAFHPPVWVQQSVVSPTL